MEYMLMPFRRYADFEGRSSRREYWMFFLFNILVGVAVGVITLVMYSVTRSESAMMTVMYPVFGLYMIYTLAAFIPGIAVAIRRLHDTDRSGWSILFGLIPFVGGIILLVFYLSPGTPGPNRFGHDPKAQRWSGGPATA
jgi:uncharacterized membrane protein YhaH (DUF805 family)